MWGGCTDEGNNPLHGTTFLRGGCRVEINGWTDTWLRRLFVGSVMYCHRMKCNRPGAKGEAFLQSESNLAYGNFRSVVEAGLASYDNSVFREPETIIEYRDVLCRSPVP